MARNTTMGRPSDARQRLIEAAKQIIFTSSYAGVSVDELCAAAGVNKSSFYHFFSSKLDLVLAAIDSQWQWFEQFILAPTFSDHLLPQAQLARFFDLAAEKQYEQKKNQKHMGGCPAGNLTLEMSTQDELIRLRVEQFFQQWLSYFEHMLHNAKKQNLVPPSLDIPRTAQALLAYFEGVILLAKGRNDPSLISLLKPGVFALMQYKGNEREILT